MLRLYGCVRENFRRLLPAFTKNIREWSPGRTGRPISRAGDGELARRSRWRLHPRDGPRERPQHADVYPPPRCADCGAPALSAANLLSAAGLEDMQPPRVNRLDRRDGRARRRIDYQAQGRAAFLRVPWSVELGRSQLVSSSTNSARPMRSGCPTTRRRRLSVHAVLHARSHHPSRLFLHGTKWFCGVISRMLPFNATGTS